MLINEIVKESQKKPNIYLWHYDPYKNMAFLSGIFWDIGPALQYMGRFVNISEEEILSVPEIYPWFTIVDDNVI